MKKLFRPGIILGLILLLILASGIVSLKNLSQVKAYGLNDGVILHIKYEASTDNGVTWHNFSGTPDLNAGESVTAKPGDTVLIKVTTWNTGGTGATDVTGAGTANTSHITDVSILTNDGLYSGFFITVGGSGGIASIPGGTPEIPGKTFTASLQLDNNFPLGQTIIDSEVTISNYARVVGFNPFELINKAYADGAGDKSAIRIVVNNDQTSPLPQTGMDIR